MINKDQKNKKQCSTRGVKLYDAIFILIILLFLLSIYYVLWPNTTLIQTIDHGNTINNTFLDSKERISPENLEKRCNQEVESIFYSTGRSTQYYQQINNKHNQKLQIQLHAALQQALDDKMVISPNNTSIGTASKEVSQSILKIKLHYYRTFLSNIHQLLKKYNNNINYINELRIFNNYTHPPYINDIVRLLEMNITLSKLNNTIVDDRIIRLTHKKIIGQFIKIKKIDNLHQDLLELKSNINARLDLFMDYVYSQELQNTLVN